MSESLSLYLSGLSRIYGVLFIFLKEGENVETMYINYLCGRCHKETILISSEVEDTKRNGNYISCSHCGSKKLKEQQATDNFKQCMEHSAYRRIRGSLRQIHSE